MTAAHTKAPEEFNRYFISGNGVQPNARISVPTAEWQALYAALRATVAEALPHPGSPEASAMMDSVLAEYNYPSNSKNCARAGYVAAQRLLAKRGEDSQVVNQCDGCQVHAPWVGSKYHRMPDGGLMGCSKARYQSSETK